MLGWGRNDENQLTDNNSMENTGKPFTLTRNAKAISAGEYHSLVLTKDNKILAWGDGFSKSPQELEIAPEFVPLLFVTPWMQSLKPTTLEQEIRKSIKDSISL